MAAGSLRDSSSNIGSTNGLSGLVLALSALLANSNAKESASDIAIVGTARTFSPNDNAILTHSGV